MLDCGIMRGLGCRITRNRAGIRGGGGDGLMSSGTSTKQSTENHNGNTKEVSSHKSPFVF